MFLRFDAYIYHLAMQRCQEAGGPLCAQVCLVFVQPSKYFKLFAWEINVNFRFQIEALKQIFPKSMQLYTARLPKPVIISFNKLLSNRMYDLIDGIWPEYYYKNNPLPYKASWVEEFRQGCMCKWRFLVKTTRKTNLAALCANQLACFGLSARMKRSALPYVFMLQIP